jgi:hypothetical protein
MFIITLANDDRSCTNLVHSCFISEGIRHSSIVFRINGHTRILFWFIIATGYGPDHRGIWVRLPMRTRIFNSPYRPDRLRGPPNLLSNGYRELLPWGKATGPWSWPLVWSSAEAKKTWSIHPLHIRLHGVVLSQLSTGTTLRSVGGGAPTGPI